MVRTQLKSWGVLMRIQEKISGPDVLLKLFVAIEDTRKTWQERLAATQLPRSSRGGIPHLSAAKVITMLVWRAWRGLTDKATWYYSLRTYHRQEFPAIGSYSKFIEATNRYSLELYGLLRLLLAQNRHAQHAYPIVFQDSTALAVCKVRRASQHWTCKDWTQKSQMGSGWWNGVKVHAQGEAEGRLSAFALTTATVDDHKLLNPFTQWIDCGVEVGDKGSLSQAKAREVAARQIFLLTATCKNMRHLARQFQLACLQVRHRIEELFEFLKCAFGLVRTIHRAAYALPIHVLVCLVAYSLYKQLIA